jgi:hypothetical protein
MGNGSHFTYIIPPSSERLEQGDVLEKNDEIKALVREVHPHYLKDDYSHFIILTQSCDIVRLKAPYLTLAAVRPLSLVLQREIEDEQSHDLEREANCLSVAKRSKFTDFLTRLKNNNHTEYFYLHEDPIFGFSEPRCAFLRLSIAIRTPAHYSKCLNARIFSLESTFKAKLGWLVGNIYSRVGTPDWVPDNATQREFTKSIDDLLDSACLWVDKDRLAKAKKLYKQYTQTKTKENLRELINSAHPLSKKDQTIERIVTVLTEYEELNNESLLSSIRTRLQNDADLKTILG